MLRANTHTSETQLSSLVRYKQLKFYSKKAHELMSSKKVFSLIPSHCRSSISQFSICRHDGGAFAFHTFALVYFAASVGGVRWLHRFNSQIVEHSHE